MTARPQHSFIACDNHPEVVDVRHVDIVLPIKQDLLEIILTFYRSLPH